jgi:hypothetical protein
VKGLQGRIAMQDDVVAHGGGNEVPERGVRMVPEPTGIEGN